MWTYTLDRVYVHAKKLPSLSSAPGLNAGMRVCFVKNGWKVVTRWHHHFNRNVINHEKIKTRKNNKKSIRQVDWYVCVCVHQYLPVRAAILLAYPQKPLSPGLCTSFQAIYLPTLSAVQLNKICCFKPKKGVVFVLAHIPSVD
jgi:hypothetical protein